MALENGGGLWKREGGSIDGEIEINVGGQKVRLKARMVKNLEKKEDKHPDYRLEIGGIWKATKDGAKYVASGNIELDREKVSFFLFKNDDGKEKNPKAPDYRIAFKVDDEAKQEGVPF